MHETYILNVAAKFVDLFLCLVFSVLVATSLVLAGIFLDSGNVRLKVKRAIDSGRRANAFNLILFFQIVTMHDSGNVNKTISFLP